MSADPEFLRDLTSRVETLRTPFERWAAQLGPSFEARPPHVIVIDLAKGYFPAQFVHETAIIAARRSGSGVAPRLAAIKGSRNVFPDELAADIEKLVTTIPPGDDPTRVVIATESAYHGVATTAFVEGFAKLGIVADLASFQTGNPPAHYRERIEALAARYPLVRNPELFVGEQSEPGLPGFADRGWAFIKPWWVETAAFQPSPHSKVSLMEHTNRRVAAVEHVRRLAHEVYPTPGQGAAPQRPGLHQ